jgi:hypothetical protein
MTSYPFTLTPLSPYELASLKRIATRGTLAHIPEKHKQRLIELGTIEIRDTGPVATESGLKLIEGMR